MTFHKKSSFVVVAVAMLMSVTACGQTGDYIKVTGPYFTGADAKKEYKAFLGTGLTTLNYAKSQTASDSTHVANFVDGLVMNDEYGILRKQLAEKVTHNSDYSVFTFDIKQNIPWYTSTGEQFSSDGVKQFVKADDFINTAEIILNYANSSELGYLVALFLKGGWEYYSYTLMNYLKKQIGSFAHYPKSGKVDPNTKAPYTVDNPAPDGDCKFDYRTLKNATNDQIAAQLNNLISHEGSLPLDEFVHVTAADLADVASFKRVGVKVGANENQLVYTLSASMNYFPTVLTYSPFMPINRAFFNQQKMSGFGTGADKILYNGPYTCSKWEGSDIWYKKNENYYDADKVHINSVIYKVLETSISPSYVREQFNNGEVDGFGLSKDDTVGWSEYITGTDGTGTIEKPYSPLVNSRELDLIDSLFSFNININRSTDYLQNTIVTADEIANANSAMKIKEVRSMLLDGVDLSVYNKIFVEKQGAQFADQYTVNTIIPRKFAYDENTKDYVDYFVEEYANRKGISTETSKEMWSQQQADGVNLSDAEYDTFKTQLASPAKLAIEKYNEAVDAGAISGDGESKISFPVIFEVLGNGAMDSDVKDYETKWMQNLNEKMNGCRLNSSAAYSNIELPECPSNKAYPYFEVVPNTKVTSSATYSTMSQGGYYSFGLVWGWGPDYADPLTYLHQFVNNGDMAKYGGWTSGDKSYTLNSTGSSIVKNEMLKNYTDLVAAAAKENNSILRYQAFAKAEYELRENAKVTRPTYMSTLGYSASVSHAIGYENPTSSYGLASNRLTGMWVLKDIPTGQQRVEARSTQATLKKEALDKSGGLIAIY